MAVSVSPDEKRRWYALALRHVRMARRLLNTGFADGAVFHGYHAYECALSAFIAANGFPVPPEGWTKLTTPSGTTIHAYSSPGGGIQDRQAHRARIAFFNELQDPTKVYAVLHAALSRFVTIGLREESLYYDPVRGLLPHQRYNRLFAAELLAAVRRFARAVWSAIR